MDRLYRSDYPTRILRELAKDVDYDRFFDIGVRLGFGSEEPQTLGNEYTPDDCQASVELLSRWRINPIPETATKETLQRIIDDTSSGGPDGLDEQPIGNDFHQLCVTFHDLKTTNKKDR